MTDHPVTSNKRILRNTMFLYFRMMLLMLISFYTSRVVLQTLRVDDFGIYNVVGGIVAMLGFFSNSLSLASNRFFAFAIGKQDNHLLSRTYSTSAIILFWVSLIIVILAETVGLWYFYYMLNIPLESRSAAMWVYQLSVISTFIALNNVPNMSLVISHEDMDAFGYISVLEGALKLCVALLLVVTPFGNLKAYAIMMFMVSLIVRGIWVWFSHRKYRHVKFTRHLDKDIFNEIKAFMGWNVVSSLSWLLRGQGVNLVLNFFFGPALNTARALGQQVNSGITSLVNNFQMATNPQLVKNYAADDHERMQLLLFRSSKMSFMFLFIFAFPILVAAEPIMKMWLGQIPPYALIFVKLIIIATLIDALSGTLQHTAMATGKIKRYTQVVTLITLSDIVLVFGAFKMGMPPTAMIYTEMIICFAAFIARLLISREIYSLSIKEFIYRVTLRELAVAGTVIGLYGLRILIRPIDIHFIPELFIMFLVAVVSCYYIGLTAAERKWVSSLALEKLKRK